MKIKEKPEKDKTNNEVIKMLTLCFKVPESRIKLVKGFKKRNKIFKIK